MGKNVKICPYGKKCGGCQLLNLPYEEQLRHKQVKVIRLLGKFCHVREIIGMDNPYHYRNKAQYAFGSAKNGQISAGIYQSSTHKIVDIESCMLTHPKADEIALTVKKLLKSFKLKPYNEDTKQGFLRHVLVKNAFKTGEIMVVLVTGTPIFPKKQAFINALLKSHPEITTVVQSINNKRTSMVLGDRSQVLYGDGKITEELCALKFRISPKAFYQINPVQTEILYNKALEFADFKGVIHGQVHIGLTPEPVGPKIFGHIVYTSNISHLNLSVQMRICGHSMHGLKPAHAIGRAVFFTKS